MSGSARWIATKGSDFGEKPSKTSGGIMESRAKFLGHPIHQQLIVFPLGLLGMAVIFDLITFATKNTRWTEVAFYMIGAGILTALLSAIFGLVDWMAIPRNTRAKRVGMVHGVGNVLV